MKLPDDYKCSECSVNACKLWRLESDPGRHYTYQHHIPSPKLWCVDCLCKATNVAASMVGEDGRLAGVGSMATVYIGECCPALPMPVYSNSYKSGAYFEYTNAPFLVRKWWHALPLRGQKEKDDGVLRRDLG